MKRRIDAALANGLSRWVGGVDGHARLVIAGILAATLLLGLYVVFELGINSDNMSLVPDQLPSRQAHLRFIEHFPNLDEAMFVVVDAETPELAREAASRLTERLQQEDDVVEDAYLPGGGEFFEQNGLLYRTPEELDAFADELARIQPLIGELERDDSLTNVSEIIRDGLAERDPGADDAAQWVLVLDRMSEATLRAVAEQPIAVSWEEVLLQGSSLDLATRRVIVVHPILDYDYILVARGAIARIRDVAVELGLSPERGVTVRITGNPALNQEEMLGFVYDLGAGGAICFVLVTLILTRALRSVKLVVATLITLVVGLVWTMAFTTVAIGYLNPLTLSFAIIFIGLGVDFGIHLGAGYADRLRQGLQHHEAIRDTAAHVGSALTFCTVSTAIGFYVFVPTQYRGVSQLGLIAGTSMFVIFFLTMTLFPALLSTWLRLDPARELGKPVHFRADWWSGVLRHAAIVRWTALAAGIGALFLLPGVRFDCNVVELRDPRTESVQAFKDLLDDARTTPWYLNVLMPDLDSAVALADDLERLEEVDYSVTLASFVPEQQDEKLEILADIAYLFERPPGLPERAPAHTPEEQLDALRALRDDLGDAAPAESDAALGAAMRRLHDHLAAWLERVAATGDEEAALARLDAVMLQPLPAQLERLRRALDPDRITLDDLPPQLVRRMVTAEGITRVQVFPSSDLDTIEEMQTFVGAVQAATPNVAGVPLNMVEFGQVTSESFTRALILAMGMIALMIWLLWRRLSDVVVIMLPLCLGALCTTATAVAVGMPFDFANVIVIPLLFGIGVDSAIHLVARQKEGLGEGESLLGTTTARMVYYSALTTGASFGSLSLAGHNGMASLGRLLTIGLVFTVVSVMVVLPALLDLRGETGSETGEGAPAEEPAAHPSAI